MIQTSGQTQPNQISVVRPANSPGRNEATKQLYPRSGLGTKPRQLRTIAVAQNISRDEFDANIPKIILVSNLFVK